MNEQEYKIFYNELVHAETAEVHDFEMTMYLKDVCLLKSWHNGGKKLYCTVH